MNNRRRITIIIISVTIGTVLSAFLLAHRLNGLKGNDVISLVFNMIIAIAVVVGIGVVLRKGDKANNDN